MIIDVHIHSRPGKNQKDTLTALRGECRRNGVALCLLSSLGVDTWPRYPTKKEVRAANDEAGALASNSKGLLRWYAYLNPQNADWREEMDRCAAKGAVGIKLWVSLKDQRGKLAHADKVLESAGRRQLPLLIHAFNRTGENLPGEITFPEFMELARRHPGVKMIAAHAGTHWPSEAGLFRRRPNVWVDISGGYPVKGQVETLVREMGADRVLFGSDALGRSQASQLAKVMLADISETDKRKILYQNAAALFEFDSLPVDKTLPKSSKCPVDTTEDHFCFCGHWPFFKTDYQTPRSFHAALAGSGIQRAYTADLGGIYRQDLAAANDDFLTAVHGLKKIKPLAIVNPRLPNWRSVLEKTSRQFAGIILFPFLHAWCLADTRYAALFRWCRQHKIKLWINCGLDDDRFRHGSAVSRPVSAGELMQLGYSPQTPECVFQAVGENLMHAFLKRHAGNRRFRFEISRLTDASGALRRMSAKYSPVHFVMGSESPFRDMRAVRWTSRRVL